MQAKAISIAQNATSSSSDEEEVASSTDDKSSDEDAKVIGQIAIPALHLVAPITRGVGHEALLRGVGQVPGTAALGGLGTVGLAGHRDTFFRPLRDVKKGMEVTVSGTAGSFRYIVDTTEVVSPKDVRVLKTAETPQLRLVTCYPFHYIGPAPQRFIVSAHLLSAAGD